MKEIIDRLHESRQIELAKSILESKGYQVLKESFPPILNRLSKYDKETVRKALINKLNIDIENTPYETITLSGARDPRIKDTGAMLIFPIKSGVRHWGSDVGVWLRGEFILNPEVRTDNGEGKLQQLSWKSIMSVTDNPTMIKFDQATSSAMKAKQDARKDSQSGMVKRYSQKELDNMPYDKRRRLRNLDKSGYEMNPRKYVDMLAALKIKNAEQILQDAKDTYVKLAQQLSTENLERNGSTWDSYEYIMREIPSEFSNLSKSLAEYNANKDKAEERSDWWMEHLEGRVKSAITNLRELVKKSQKYLS